ncbi:MAG: hypothetical protein ACE365_07915 [Gammaproteobacteria bacterium]
MPNNQVDLNNKIEELLLNSGCTKEVLENIRNISTKKYIVKLSHLHRNFQILKQYFNLEQITTIATCPSSSSKRQTNSIQLVGDFASDLIEKGYSSDDIIEIIKHHENPRDALVTLNDLNNKLYGRFRNEDETWSRDLIQIAKEHTRLNETLKILTDDRYIELRLRGFNHQDIVEMLKKGYSENIVNAIIEKTTERLTEDRKNRILSALDFSISARDFNKTLDRLNIEWENCSIMERKKTSHKRQRLKHTSKFDSVHLLASHACYEDSDNYPQDESKETQVETPLDSCCDDSKTSNSEELFSEKNEPYRTYWHDMRRDCFIPGALVSRITESTDIDDFQQIPLAPDSDRIYCSSDEANQLEESPNFDFCDSGEQKIYSFFTLQRDENRPENVKYDTFDGSPVSKRMRSSQDADEELDYSMFHSLKPPTGL